MKRVLCALTLVSQFIVRVPPTSATYFTGQTRTAATCSRTDVQTQITAAADRDIVAIPACSQTDWTTEIAVSKAIWIKGAGQGSTIIGDNVTKDGSSSTRLISFSVNTPKSFAMSNLTIVGVATDPSQFNKGHIAVAGSSISWRIHHLTMTTAQTRFIVYDGGGYGLIDHISVDGDTSSKGSVLIHHTTWGGSDYGDASWAEQLYWGTEKAIYVEDSTFTNRDANVVANIIDCLNGGRFVFRHNALTGVNLTSHGTDSGQRTRACRSQEVYSNTYSFSAAYAVDFMTWVRGGTGTIYSNTVTVPGGCNQMTKGDNLRDGSSFTPWGICDGSSMYDQNSGGGTGYRCVDQPGAGTSNDLGGTTTPPNGWVGNAVDPFYVWGNTITGSCSNNSVGSTTHVQSGRDYFNNGTTRPGYAAYTYPHPLQAGP